MLVSQRSHPHSRTIKTIRISEAPSKKICLYFVLDLVVSTKSNACCCTNYPITGCRLSTSQGHKFSLKLPSAASKPQSRLGYHHTRRHSCMLQLHLKVDINTNLAELINKYSPCIFVRAFYRMGRRPEKRSESHSRDEGPS